MSDRTPDNDHGTDQQADLANPEQGTRPTDASVERDVGPRTPERREGEQLRNAGVEDVEGEGNVVPELAPKQTTGGPAEVDRVPNIKK